MTGLSEMKGERSICFGTFELLSIFRFDKASSACLVCPDGTPQVKLSKMKRESVVQLCFLLVIYCTYSLSVGFEVQCV